MVSTRLSTDAAGRPVLVKEAVAEADAERLGHEAQVLAAARHPGVVEVAWASNHRLVLRWAGSRSLADLHPRVEEAASLVAALAATVADLHALGIRHGRITANRVLLDSRGRPVLCGFGGAALASDTGPGTPTKADDVAGVGAVLRAVVGGESELEPIPERRMGRRTAWPGALRRALLTLADQATHDDPARRPSAAALAAAVVDLVPAAAGDDERGGRSRALRRVLVGAVALGVGGFVVTSVVGAPSASAPDAVPAVGEAIRRLECAPVVGLAVDHDGDGCPSATRIDGEVVEVDGTRYGVGQPGDALAVGDWDCDGAATVAAVRPSTGEVFVFDGWAGPAADVVVPAATRVPGAVRPDADDPDGDGCATLVVLDADGGRTEVPA